MVSQIIILNESIIDPTEHLIVNLVVHGQVLILSNHCLLLEAEIVLLLDHGLRETLGGRIM